MDKKALLEKTKLWAIHSFYLDEEKQEIGKAVLKMIADYDCPFCESFETNDPEELISHFVNHPPVEN